MIKPASRLKMIHLGDYEQYYIRKAGGPDPETRVVSAVWTLSDPVNGMARLGLTWPDGNDTNETSE